MRRVEAANPSLTVEAPSLAREFPATFCKRMRRCFGVKPRPVRDFVVCYDVIVL